MSKRKNAKRHRKIRSTNQIKSTLLNRFNLRIITSNRSNHTSTNAKRNSSKSDPPNDPHPNHFENWRKNFFTKMKTEAEWQAIEREIRLMNRRLRALRKRVEAYRAEIQ